MSETLEENRTKSKITNRRFTPPFKQCDFASTYVQTYIHTAAQIQIIVGYFRRDKQISLPIRLLVLARFSLNSAVSE